MTISRVLDELELELRSIEVSEVRDAACLVVCVSSLMISLMFSGSFSFLRSARNVIFRQNCSKLCYFTYLDSVLLTILLKFADSGDLVIAKGSKTGQKLLDLLRRPVRTMGSFIRDSRSSNGLIGSS
ncbi:hypothetical protein B9Z55_027993 [Caenorhabditis nigoni]|uniref:Uncharacterized protein n=1 Tax=Caenorhabditis nigoni TaxID=1611254 RepID=A0A2G5SDY4_9PELO|nr:hypothetical protein B9Z55_027993 [Caenorhabditis nigoni]